MQKHDCPYCNCDEYGLDLSVRRGMELAPNIVIETDGESYWIDTPGSQIDIVVCPKCGRLLVDDE